MRPVRVRNTSSSVGRCTSIESSETPLASRSRSRPGTALPARATRPRTWCPRPRRRSAIEPSFSAATCDLVVVGDLEVDQVAGDLRLEVVGGVAGDDPALVDDQDPVGQRVGLVEVVGGQEHRRAAARPQALDVLPEVGPRLRVQAGGRLVEEDQRRVVDQAHHDVEAALLAAGHVLGHPLPEALELELVEQLPAPLLGEPARHPVEHPVVHHLVAGAGGARTSRPPGRRSRCCGVPAPPP